MKNQIRRYQASHSDAYVKESDPNMQELTDDTDVYTTKITLAIVLTAFVISPMTECLGPVLELNVKCSFQFRFQSVCDVYRGFIYQIKHTFAGSTGSHTAGIHFTRACLHQNGHSALNIQSRETSCVGIGSVWQHCDIGGIGITYTQHHWRL